MVCCQSLRCKLRWGAWNLWEIEGKSAYGEDDVFHSCLCSQVYQAERY
jgi:hypothetical protein